MHHEQVSKNSILYLHISNILICSGAGGKKEKLSTPILSEGSGDGSFVQFVIASKIQLFAHFIYCVCLTDTKFENTNFVPP